MPETTGSTPTTADLGTVAAGHWTVDPAGTSVRLRHKTMWGLATVKGAFGDVRGEAEVAADGSAHGSVTLGAASLDTENAKRDTHLRSADFFDADNHPEIVFTATGATPGEGGKVDVAGTLTVRGTTKPLAFTAQATEAGPDAVTLTAEVQVDRADHGLTWNQMGMLKGTAGLSLTLRFVRAAAA